MIVQLKNVSKFFYTETDRIEAVSNFSMQVGKGRFISLLGPSGCGKSTIFKMICGLLTPDRGAVQIHGQNGRKVRELISYMPQKDLLMPWRTVLENVILPLEIAGKDMGGAREEALALFPLFGLEGFANSFPDALSGGMSQRAALLRTLLAGGELMLLDEPFGALDAITRFKMQQWLQKVWMKFGKTILFITHDIEEAIFLSDEVYVMSARPGTLRERVDVPFLRPRGPSLLTQRDFIQVKAALVAALSFEPNNDDPTFC